MYRVGGRWQSFHVQVWEGRVILQLHVDTLSGSNTHNLYHISDYNIQDFDSEDLHMLCSHIAPYPVLVQVYINRDREIVHIVRNTAEDLVYSLTDAAIY